MLELNVLTTHFQLIFGYGDALPQTFKLGTRPPKTHLDVALKHHQTCPA